jgi:hypothetical protein
VLRERAAGGAAVALPVDAALQLGSDAVRAIARPGVTFELTPPDYRLADLIDAYIYLVN